MTCHHVASASASTLAHAFRFLAPCVRAWHSRQPLRRLQYWKTKRRRPDRLRFAHRFILHPQSILQQPSKKEFKFYYILKTIENNVLQANKTINRCLFIRKIKKKKRKTSMHLSNLISFFLLLHISKYVPGKPTDVGSGQKHFPRITAPLRHLTIAFSSLLLNRFDRMRRKLQKKYLN